MSEAQGRIGKEDKAAMTSIFVSGPFFNSEQNAVIGKIEQLLFSKGIQFYSPRLAVKLEKNSSVLEQDKAFQWDTICLDLADWAIAVIDDWDAGTMWEIGYCHPKGNAKKRVIAYSDVPDRRLNVMLARSCYAFVNGIQELEDWLTNKMPKEWKGEVF